MKMTEEYQKEMLKEIEELANDIAKKFNSTTADEVVLQMGTLLIYHRRFFKEKGIMGEYQEWAMEEEMRAQGL